MLQRKVLDVPSLVQPTSTMCQSTCLKMFAKYLAKKIWPSNPAGENDIQQIWNEIDTGKARPSQVRNS
ncbi:MAG: papain-like cysteine protease family protein [Nitrospirales bacterium]